MVWGLKGVILSTAPLLRTAAILKCTAVPSPPQLHTKMADERKFSIEPFSFKPDYSRDNLSESSSDKVQSGEDESNRFSGTIWCQCAKYTTSTLKNPVHLGVVCYCFHPLHETKRVIYHVKIVKQC